MRYYINGDGLVNDVINKLPFELHIPTYSFCGPGTRLQERLLRGDKPINGLDAGCMKHDIAYHNSKDLTSRHKADKELADIAMQRFKSRDASIGEKIAALSVAGAMKAKVKLGMGFTGGGNSYRNVVDSCSKSLEKIRTEADKVLKTIESYKAVLVSRKAQRKNTTKKPVTLRNIKKEKPQLEDKQDFENMDTVLIANRKRHFKNNHNNDYQSPPVKRIKIDPTITTSLGEVSLKRKLDNSYNDDDDDDDDYVDEPPKKYLKTD